MKTAFVHIGLLKTGTSSIQLALSERRKRLQEFSVLYPGSAANHTDLFLAFTDHAHLEHRNVRRGIYTAEAASDINRAALEAYRSELGKTAARDLLLSAEGFSQLTESGVARLRGFLLQFTKQVVVICFVRSPVGYATSYAQEALIEGKLLRDSLRQPELPRYREKLTRFVNAFGKSSLRLVNYDRIRAQGSSLVAGFSEAMESDVLQSASVVARAGINAAITQEGALLLDAVNRIQPPFRSERRNAERGNVPRTWVQALGGTRFHMPPEWCRRVRSLCREDVEWLWENFKVGFKEDEEYSEPPNPTCAVLSPRLIDDLGKLLHKNALLIDHCMKEIFLLKSQIAELHGDFSGAVKNLEQIRRIDPELRDISGRLADLRAAEDLK